MTTQPRTVETFRIVLPAAVISLVVTLLRLAGELGRWSEPWFSRDTGGVVPSGVSWIVGITWLPVPFGIYFAYELAQEGFGPRSSARAVGIALAGLGVGLGGVWLAPRLGIAFPQVLALVWLSMAVAGALQWWGWPELTKLLLVYAYAARIPVAIVMFLAMLGGWGTHYDYVDAGPRIATMTFWPRFLWLAFLPQLVFWVGFTLVLGALAGALTAVVLRGRRVD